MSTYLQIMKTPSMPDKDRSRKRMSGEDRREQIVKVAAALFSKNGFRGTTTREIARKAGISEAVIYKHFAKKEDLYKAIIDARCTDDSGQHLLINAIKGKEGREMFRDAAYYLITVNQNDPSFLRLLTFSALEKHNLSEMFVKTKGLELFEFLKERIEELIKKGLFRPVDPAMAARAFTGMVLYYSFSQELYGFKRYFRWKAQDVADAFVDLFFNGIEKKD